MTCEISTEDEGFTEGADEALAPLRAVLRAESAPQFRFAGIDVPAADWTTDPETSRSNSSPEYLRLRAEIARLILSEAHSLVGSGRAAVENVAALILSDLAHKQNMAPAGSTSALEAAHARVGALLAELERLRRACTDAEEDRDQAARLVPDPGEVVVRRDDLREAMNYLTPHWAGRAAGLDRLTAAAGAQ